MLKVIIFSKLISLIYFNVFIEDFELLMLVSSLIYLGFFCFFVLEIKFCFLFVFLNKLTALVDFRFSPLRGFTLSCEGRHFWETLFLGADAAMQRLQGLCVLPSL